MPAHHMGWHFLGFMPGPDPAWDMLVLAVTIPAASPVSGGCSRRAAAWWFWRCSWSSSSTVTSSRMCDQREKSGGLVCRGHSGNGAVWIKRGELGSHLLSACGKKGALRTRPSAVARTEPTGHRLVILEQDIGGDQLIAQEPDALVDGQLCVGAAAHRCAVTGQKESRCPGMGNIETSRRYTAAGSGTGCPKATVNTSWPSSLPSLTR